MDERGPVARLKAGDAEAFEDLYEALRPRLFSFLLRMSRNRELAEDLLEETWLRLVERAPELDDDTPISPWLFTVARNLFASHCRHRAVDTAWRAAGTPAWQAAPGESPFQAAARGETERRLEAAVDRVPSCDRELLLLVAVEELTPRDAAAVLDVTPDVLRKRLQRARERLAHELREPTPARAAKAG